MTSTELSRMSNPEEIEGLIKEIKSGKNKDHAD